MKVYQVSFYFVFALLVGCSSATKVAVQSNPVSEVFVLDETLQVKNKIGMTPLEVDLKDLAGEKNFVYLRFKKEGYDDFRIVLPKDWNNGQLNVSLSPYEKYAPEELKNKVLVETKELNTRQIMVILDIQREIMKQNLPLATSRLSELRQLQTPEPVIQLIEGNIQFLSGNKDRALALYESALQKDPSNNQLREIVSKLQKERN